MSHFCDAGGHPLSAAVAILRQSNQVALAVRKSAAEEVVQVYGFCIRTLRLPVISVMIIGVIIFAIGTCNCWSAKQPSV